MSRSPWSLSAAAFDGLLTVLDADRDRAAVEYERIRARLVKFFEWRGCTRADEYADRTVDRVARRLAEGAEVRTRDPYAFFHGVALNLLQEYWREPVTQWAPIDEGERGPAVTQANVPGSDEGKRELDASLDCLERCLATLRDDGRQLLARYHADADHIRARRALASELGIPLNALRIRVFRLRATIERCVTDCLARQSRT